MNHLRLGRMDSSQYRAVNSYKAYSDLIFFMRQQCASSRLSQQEFDSLVGLAPDLYREFCSVEQGHAGTRDTKRLEQAAEAITRKLLVLHPELVDEVRALGNSPTRER